MLIYTDKKTKNKNMLEAFAATTGATEVASDTASQLTNLIELLIIRIPLFFAAFIVIGVFYGLAKIGRKIIENKLAESGIEEEHKEIQILGGRLTFSGILILGITIGLKIAGIDLTAIIAAVAFGIGFALKDMIMNFLAGMMILIGRHFTIGDFINVGGTIGRVVEIQSRVTILQAIDGTKVIVPNADLFTKQVVSYTSNPFRRIELMVGVDYRHDLDNVLKIVTHAVKATKGILLNPAPGILIDGFGESSIDIKVKAWVESKGGWVKIKSALAKNIKNAFDKYGIVIPWPIRTISYDKDSQMSEQPFKDEIQQSAPQVVTQAVIPQQPVPQKATVNVAQASAADSDDEQPLKPLGEV